MDAKGPVRLHVVLVSRDAGLWFDEVLESIAAQDVPLESVTVVDANSESDPTARVQRLLPQAVVRRLGFNPGYGLAANQALRSTGPAPDFYVFCHDDVVLAPDALRLLAEEAVRSNAGIVAPKQVDWDNHRRLLHVGLQVDELGVEQPTVEEGELDQGQHDAVVETFAVAGGCVLVRGDLFRAIGGFDPKMSFCYEHVDLCWRARIAGARVVVAPAAVVRHRQRLGERLPDSRIEGLARRHRVRTLLTVYGALNLVRVIPRALALSAIEMVGALATGHLSHTRRIGAAWGYNLVRPLSIWKRRRAVRRIRQVGDPHVSASQARGNATLASLLVSWRDGDTPSQGGPLALATRTRNAAIVGTVTVVLALIGARELFTGGIPAAGDLARLGSSSELLSGWWSDYRPVGLGQDGLAAGGLGVLTLLSWLFFGETDLLRTVLIIGMVPLGALGMWRLMRPFDSQWIQGVALAVYLANPVPYNALANGVWSGLLMYAAVPWLMRAVLVGSKLAPYGPVEGSPGPGMSPPSFLREGLSLGLVIGLAGALANEVLLVTGLVLVGLILGSLIAGTASGLVRMAVVAALGTAVAAALNFPWLIDGLPTLLGDRPGGNGGNSWAEILRFDTGPFGDGRLGWALPVAAVLPLALADDSRLAWAVRGWTLYLGTAAVALVSEQGWLPMPLPRPEVLQVPGAVGLAIAVSMGVAAFLVDIRHYRFGWRQLVPFTAVAALVAGMMPALGVVTGGDWNATRGDYTDVVPFSEQAIQVPAGQVPASQTSPGQAPASQDSAIQSSPSQAANSGGGPGHRVLWLGHPDVLPLASWNLHGPVSFSVSSSREFPTVAQRWAGPLDGHTHQVAEAVRGATVSGTGRLGAELSQWGIGTILVAERLAPEPYGELTQPAPEWLFNLLDGQLDLAPGGLTAGIATYHNTAISAEDVQAALARSPDDGTSSASRVLLVVQVVLWAIAVTGIARLAANQRRRLRRAQ